MYEPILLNKSLRKTLRLSPALFVAPLALFLGAGCVPDGPPKEDMAMGEPDLAMMPRVDLASDNKDMATSRPDLSSGGDMAGGRGDMAGAVDMAGGRGDMAGAVDMAGGRGDMAGAVDMAGGRGDMAGAVDMAGGRTVTGLPTCTDTGITADILFTTVAKPNCANGGCHAAGEGGLTFTSGPTLKSAVVGIASKQTMLMPIVTASNVDLSYLMYKLTNEQNMAGGHGSMMPKGKARLADADLCKFIVWVKEGAN